MAKINVNTSVQPTDKDINERPSERMRQRSAVIAASACKAYNLAAIRKRLADCLRNLPAQTEDSPC